MTDRRDPNQVMLAQRIELRRLNAAMQKKTETLRLARAKIAAFESKMRDKKFVQVEAPEITQNHVTILRQIRDAKSWWVALSVQKFPELQRWGLIYAPTSKDITLSPFGRAVLEAHERSMDKRLRP